MSNRTIRLLLLAALLFLTGATPRTLNGGCSFALSASDLALTNLKLCQVPDTATLQEISIIANAGTPSVTMGRYRPSGASTVALTSSALTTGASGALASSPAGARAAGVSTGTAADFSRLWVWLIAALMPSTTLTRCACIWSA